MVSLESVRVTSLSWHSFSVFCLLVSLSKKEKLGQTLQNFSDSDFCYQLSCSHNPVSYSDNWFGEIVRKQV